MGRNPIAVRTQQTGVNPKTKVTRFHTLTSKRINARAGSTRPNQDERSSSRNVFRTLGHRANLRDTLNIKRDQERSQQATAQNRQPLGASRGQGGILVEDLHRAITAMKENDMELITAATGSPSRLPQGFKLLAIKAYDGKSDLQDHLDHFNDLMELHLVSKLEKCIVFAVTLTGGAKKWFRSILVRLITNWQQLSTLFLQYFQATRKRSIPSTHLGNVK